MTNRKLLAELREAHRHWHASAGHRVGAPVCGYKKQDFK
jgi:hypothetical protein